MAPTTRSPDSPPGGTFPSVLHRHSRTALLAAGLAALSFVLFGALDLDGLTLALLASTPASALGTTSSDPDTDRWHMRTHAALVPDFDTRTIQRAVTSNASAHHQRLQVVRPRHLPSSHSAPASADPF